MTKSRDKIPPLEVDSSLAYTNVDKSIALSNQYKQVFIQDNGHLPEIPNLISPDSFTNIIITKNDIIKSIKEMNGNGSPGIDKIHPKIIKKRLPLSIETIVIDI